MVNLLIISSSPKAKFIQNTLQPQLKARIDVLDDFDHGLKDVFEKRPAIVIIQDQIASITGESVARHIQLLLGSGAPTFIVMHEGNTRVKPIKGLFEHIVDLNQPETALTEKLVSALKTILGSGWDKVAIPIQASTGASPELFVLSEEKRDAADRLVDDFLFDLGASEQSLSDKEAADQAAAGLKKESASTDELATMLLAAVHESRILQAESDEVSSPNQPTQPGVAVQRDEMESRGNNKPDITQSSSGAETLITTTASAPETVSVSRMFDFPELEHSASPTIPAAPRVVPAAAGHRLDAGSQLKSTDKMPVKTPSPADFHISAPKATEKGPNAEDILMAFDENYHSRSRTWLVLAVVALAVLIAGWYLLNHHIDLLSLIQKPKPSAKAVGPSTSQPGNVKKSEPLSTAQKPLMAKVPPKVTAVPTLPSFVAAGGRDSSFSTRKPGWERFVDKSHEVRIFSSGGRIKAIQVMAVKGQVIPDSFLKSVLKEVTGSSEFSTGTREKRPGYLIRRCRVGQKGDLLVYYEDPSKVIKAFVVSLD